MNPVLSVIQKDFLVVPDEVVNSLDAGAEVVVCGWEIEVAEHVSEDGHEQFLEEISFDSGGHVFIACAIILIVLKHQMKHVVPVQITIHSVCNGFLYGNPFF